MVQARSRLAEILDARGWSQSRLSREAGVNHMTVGWAYHSTADVSLESWVKIARALDVPLSEIAPDQADKLRGVAV